LLKQILKYCRFTTFVAMKKRNIIINFSLMLAVLFAMLLQSVHSFEHISKLFSEKECHHKYTGKTEISHQHHPFDHCFACEFTISSGIASDVLSIKIISHHIAIPCFFVIPKSIVSFSGNLNYLRGPPNFVV